MESTWDDVISVAQRRRLRRQHNTLSEWDDTLDRMKAKRARLQMEGLWYHGRPDLLRIIGRGRREIYHSQMLAWLLDPGTPSGLEHRKQIEEWAKIRSQASDEMHRWLSSWAEVMEESDLDGDRHFFAHTEGTNSPKIFWYRKEWQARPEHVGETGRPLSHTGIGFEWHRNNPHGKRGLHAGSRKWWPYYEFLEPVSEVVSERVQSSDTPYEPEDLDEVLKQYRDQQIQLIEDLWGRYADRVSEAVARAYPPPSVT